MKIGLDVHGGDFAPEATAKGACLALSALPSDVSLVLIGDTHVTKEILAKENVDLNRVEFVHCTEIIGMGEHPTKAFSKKPNSSINIGFDLLKKNQIQVFAGAGNTGAMLIGSMFTVKAVPGIIRPCITSIIPKENGSVSVILDVGANADCRPDVLVQFAKLGSIYCEQVLNIVTPRIGLLNIGEEEEKGSLLTQATHHLLKDTSGVNFIGNIEGRDVFDDKADVIVCDGFTGNIVLKQAEAFYTLIKRRKIEDEYFNRFNYEIYGGSPILGINSNVVIGHGISSPEAIKNMLLLSKDVTEARLNEKIKLAFE